MAIEKLKVFISWSGDRSRAVGEALREWLPNVLFMSEPWLSAEDIEKGAKWNQVVSGELEKSNFAVICLTPENLGAPWLLFEAGALSKRADSRVFTYLYSLEYADVKDPLSQFQHTKSNEAETRKLVETINKHLGEAALPRERLEKTFEKWWPELEAALNTVPPFDPKATTVDEKKKVPEMLTEILERVREQGREIRRLENILRREVRANPYRASASGPASGPVREFEIFDKFLHRLEESGISDSVTVNSSHGVQVGDKVFPWDLVKEIVKGRLTLDSLGVARRNNIEPHFSSGPASYSQQQSSSEPTSHHIEQYYPSGPASYEPDKSAEPE